MNDNDRDADEVDFGEDSGEVALATLEVPRFSRRFSFNVRSLLRSCLIEMINLKKIIFKLYLKLKNLP